MSKVKITVSVEEDTVADLDRVGKEEHQSRSRLVELAVKAWTRTRLEQELIAGYRAMAREDAETAEARLPAGTEILE